MTGVPDLFNEFAEPWREGLCAGVDEVGIGPLAGPVVAAAVILHPEREIDGLNDSKQLTAKRREALSEEIKRNALAWAVAYASVQEIDRLNILRASHLAMNRAVSELATAPERIYVDGNKAPAMSAPVVAVVQGDKIIPQISAASIIAKVVRDKEMQRLDELYPEYGFGKHKGYPTKAHFKALADLGALPIHRASFAPVREQLEKQMATQLPNSYSAVFTQESFAL